MREPLLERFGSVLSNASLEQFSVVLSHAESCETQSDGDVICRFSGNREWRILAPFGALEPATRPQQNRHRKLRERIERNAPANFIAFLDVCAGFQWGDVGGVSQLVLSNGFDGTLDCLADDAINEKTFGLPFSSDIFSPIDISLANYYFVHPSTGALCYQTEGLVLEVVDSVDPVEIYFRELARELSDAALESEREPPFPRAPRRLDWLREWSPAARDD